MKPIKLTTIPFPGLYETILSMGLDDEEERTAEYLAEEDDDFSRFSKEDIAEEMYWAMNYGKAHDYVAKEYAEHFAHELNANLPDGVHPFELMFESMDSPKEYNFTTDRVYMTMRQCDMDTLYLFTPEDVLERVIKERFTSRSGFISFYSNNVDDWHAKPLPEWDHNEVATLLEAFIEAHYDGGVDGLCEAVETAVYESETFFQAVDGALDHDDLLRRLRAKHPEPDAEPTSYIANPDQLPLALGLHQ